MKTADEFLTEAAKTFKERNAVYGNNFLNVGKALTGFFPEGVTLKTEEDFNRFHIFFLVIVKWTRYCNNWNKGGHADSSHDATVYSAMMEMIDTLPKPPLGALKLGEARTVRLCSECNTPFECSSHVKCGREEAKKANFVKCDACPFSIICIDEGHCDANGNGYR